jgi:hypothetical protein
MARLFVLCLLLCLGTPLAAEEPPAPLQGEALRAQVARWIADLRSDSFGVREQARAGLERHGAEARDLLEAARDDEDAEVRRTVRDILERGAENETPAPVRVEAGQIARMARLDFEVHDVPLGEAFKRFGARIGARFEMPTPPSEARVTLVAKELAPFDVLERLLQAGDLVMAGPLDRAGVGVLRPRAGAPRPPRAAVGPLQVDVIEVTSTRSLDARRQARHALKLRIQWIPLVQISQYQAPRIEVARDPDGNAFKSNAGSRVTNHGVSNHARHAEVVVPLDPLSEDCGESLAVLEMVLPIVRLQHDQQAVALDDLARMPITLDRGGKRVEPGTENAVRFDALAESADRSGQWVADLSATLLSEVAQRTLQSWITTKDGRHLPLYVAGGRSRSADGTVRITARAYGIGDGDPAGVRVTWFAREEAGDVRIRLTDIPLR